MTLISSTNTKKNTFRGEVSLRTPDSDVWDTSFEIEIKDGKVPGEVHLDDALFNKTITKEEHDEVTAFISKDVVDPSCLDKQIQELQPILDKAGVSIKVQTIASLV